MTRASQKSVVVDLTDGLSEMGYQRESFSIGSTGLGVFRVELSPEIYGYANFTFYAKYGTVGVALGFGFPELKRITDTCLFSVGRKNSIVPVHATANPCPAVLFPLEFFVGQKQGLPIELGADFVGRVRAVIHERVFLGDYSWVNSRIRLCEFLVNGKPPFGWQSSAVPRRLCQSAYLLSLQRSSFEEARGLLSPACVALQGDADFESYSGDLVLDVLEYFYSTPARSMEGG